MNDKLVKLLKLPDNAVEDQIIDAVVALNNRITTATKLRKGIADTLELPGTATDDQIISTVQGVQTRLNFHLMRKRQTDVDEERIMARIRAGLTRHQAWEVVQRENAMAAEEAAKVVVK